MIKVLGLYVKRAKGQPPEASDELVLIENMGVRGDVFSVGGDRQVSLMFKKRATKSMPCRKRKPAF